MSVAIQKIIIQACAILASPLLLIGCDKETGNPSSSLVSPQATTDGTLIDDNRGILAVTSTRVLEISENSVKHYCKTLADAVIKIDNFRTHPAPESMQAAKQEWTQAHEALMRIKYLQYLPVDHPALSQKTSLQTSPSASDHSETTTSNDTSLQQSLWARLDQTPLFGGYLDYVKLYPFSGIVNSDLPISSQTLRSEFQFADDMYVTTGLHAMEFLLWGEDGDRPVNDFQLKADTSEDDRLKISRRTELLKTMNQILKEDSDSLCATWQPTPSYYISKIRQYGSHQQLEIILQSIKGALQMEILPSIGYLLSPDDSTEEHSAFSNNSHNDLNAAFYTINKIFQEDTIKQTLADLEEGSAPTLPQLALELKDAIDKLPSPPQESDKPQRQSKDTVFIEKAHHLANQMVARIDKIIDMH